MFELFLDFEHFLLDLGVRLELGFVLFGVDEFFNLLIESGDLFLEPLVLPDEVGVDALEFLGREVFESFFDLFSLNDAGLGGGTEL